MVLSKENGLFRARIIVLKVDSDDDRMMIFMMGTFVKLCNV